MTLRPFFSYYGSKWRIAPRYPPPSRTQIIEPFAGSAGYSLRYPEKAVLLIDESPEIIAVWQWLISASPADIAALPSLGQGERIDSYDLPQQAKWLMGFWVAQGSASPCVTVTSRGANIGGPSGGNACGLFKERCARQVQHIRHWRAVCGDYSAAPDTAATWFIDPPYEQQGHRYPHHRLDYGELASWCLNRRGQVIVCENAGASWLPFRYFADRPGSVNYGRQPSRVTTEVVWTQDNAGLAA